MFEIQHVALTVATDVDYGAVPPEKQQRRRPHPKPRKANFSKKLRQDLDQPKRHFRDFLIRDGGHGGAIDPNIRLRNMASSELRRSDPVHLKETIYVQEACRGPEIMGTAGTKRKEISTEHSTQDGGQRKRVREETGSAKRGQRGHVGLVK